MTKQRVSYNETKEIKILYILFSGNESYVNEAYQHDAGKKYFLNFSVPYKKSILLQNQLLKKIEKTLKPKSHNLKEANLIF